MLNTPPGPFMAIAVGGHREVCAIAETGEIVCWGWSDDAEASVLPGRYVAIDADGGATCAVRDTGEAVCWIKGEPDADVRPGAYTAISTTGGSACGVTEAGEVLCWVPHGDEEGSADWPLGIPAPPGDRFVAVTLGHSYYLDDTVLSGCAARVSGDFVCWTSGGRHGPEEGRLWEESGDAATPLIDGDFCSVNDYGTPACNRYGAPYTAISRVLGYACGITTGGVAECQVTGLDALAFGALDVMVPPDPSPARYATIRTTGMYACALTDAGEAVCWGFVPNIMPAPDPPPGRYVAVSDGSYHTCALTEDGAVVCWGWNNFGQTDAPSGRYMAVSAGKFHTCVLTEADEVTCWGLIDQPPDGRYTAISESETSACALTFDGLWTCWGASGEYENSSEVVPVPAQARWAAVSLGEWLACVLRQSGEALCWHRYGSMDVPPGPYTAIGAGEFQVCALTEAGEIVCWYSGPDADVRAGPYTALAVGWRHACALTGAGEAECWAWSYRAYKDGDAQQSPYADELTQPPSGPFVAISSGRDRSCAVTEAGAVVCWGDVSYNAPPGPAWWPM